jgi:hypothetical protein
MQALRFLDGFLFLKVGKPNPKVMLWPNLMRRDKPWNYIALQNSKVHQNPHLSWFTKPSQTLSVIGVDAAVAQIK